MSVPTGVLPSQVARSLHHGMVIPAHPLALNAKRELDQRRQRGLSNYYLASGAGGLAVGVHTTQFAIREHGLLEPVLQIAADAARDFDQGRSEGPTLLIAGICGPTEQALAEARLARAIGYHAGLLSLAAFRSATEEELLRHARQVAQLIPVIGFYLQPSVGGRLLSYAFWRRFSEIPSVIAIKVAPFNRYQTLDVLRGVADSGRGREIALYTGNDDSIVVDLLSHYRLGTVESIVELHFCGGLLGHWACWTRSAVELFRRCQAARQGSASAEELAELLVIAHQVTDMNAAIFDAANCFRGCIAGVHEVLRQQGLLEGIWCLDPSEQLSPGQAQEINRVCEQYPHLIDDEFIASHLSSWLAEA